MLSFSLAELLSCLKIRNGDLIHLGLSSSYLTDGLEGYVTIMDRQRFFTQ